MWLSHRCPVQFQMCCRLLTMERLEGAPLTNLEAIRAISSVRSPEDILIGALNTWFGSVVACRRFHADVHAGMLYLQP